ncbi:chaplin [Streptomyces sp. DH24]|uniref:chaplin n=1 Tax=Streptomyces sp. DH24 TaxID=3040123 RepID=UPI00244245CC|nr:chaplin [Streptomyces sp. DH24]MDG9718071.1 chaplin [Streptomyces sp. DH24]
MRQVTRKGLMTVAAATGVLAGVGGAAHADSGAYGSSSGSPGVLSGNTVQAPVHAPVNVCGNTVDVVGVLNPSMGNSCVNESDGGSSGGGSHGGSDDGGYGDGGSHGGGSGGGGSHAGGETGGSPGVGSGNNVQVPIDVPVNVCGNSVNVVGALNPSMGNHCENDSGGHTTPPPGKPEKPGNPDEPNRPGKPAVPGDNEPGPQTVTQPRGSDQLAQTGGSLPLGVVLPVGAGALLAGTVLYRRSRASA